MRGDNELRIVHDEVVNSREHRELSLGRKRSFRFIEYVKPFSAEAVQQQCHERFAVGLLVQGFSTVRVDDRRRRDRLDVQPLDLRGNVEETLHAKKEPSLGAGTPFDSRKYRSSSEYDALVPKRKFFVPPSGLKPHATAIASSSVDFAEPFSPTKNVTCG